MTLFPKCGFSLGLLCFVPSCSEPGVLCAQRAEPAERVSCSGFVHICSERWPSGIWPCDSGDNNSLWTDSLDEKRPLNFPWKKAAWDILVSQVLTCMLVRSHWAELWTDLGAPVPPRAGQSTQCNPRTLHQKKCSTEVELGLLNRVWSGKTGPSLETGLSQQPHSLLSPLLLAPSCDR